MLHKSEGNMNGDVTNVSDAQTVPRSEGSWGEYGLSKAAVNCYTIELGKRFEEQLIPLLI